MADIRKSSDGELMHTDKTLQKMHYVTQIHEMLNQLKALEVEIDRVKNVHLRQIELKKATLKKMIENKNRELDDLDVIEVNIDNGGK